MPEETLYCTVGDHIWIEDVPKGATKPTVCSYHAKQAALKASRQPKTKAKSKGKTQDPKLDAKTGVPIPTEHVVPRIGTTPKPQQTLYCEAGQHEWTRPPKKGKAPKNCPEHQTKSQGPEKGSEGVQDRRRKGIRLGVLTLAEIQERYPRMDPESARVFAYYEREASRPDWPVWREQGDINAFLSGYKNRLRMVARAHGLAISLDDLPAE